MGQKSQKNPEVEESSKSSQAGTDKPRETETPEKTKGKKSSKSRIMGKMKHFREQAREEKKRREELERQTQPQDKVEQKVEELEIKYKYPDYDAEDIKVAKSIALSDNVDFDKAAESQSFKNYLRGKQESQREQEATPSPSGRTQRPSKKDPASKAKKTGRTEDWGKVLEERLFNKR